ncbi:MAG TPA: cytochrome d ubiquinol oxidase subunit II [Acidimicrobiia bacterium]|jgi:cytochrome d ubiquinol oxidase subunit II|nr:cytochrome d ubiquinol oxidase subunit II [Acidimicrobiia bacterium]
MDLELVWFGIVAIFWTGFFVLEGFDFGVGALQVVVGKTDLERRVAVNTVGPFWDGNEVWLVVAGASMFAAFPGWYATMFSALYLALLLILAALIVRGVSFEYRGKRDSERWRSTWTATLAVGSALLPLLIGIGLGDLIYGLPIDQSGEYTGSFLDLFTPFGLWVGLTLLALTLLHGATFLALRTTGLVHDRSRRLAVPFAVASFVAVAVFGVSTNALTDQGLIPGPLHASALLAVVAAGWATRSGRDGWAFIATTVAMATSVLSIFVNLYPNLMVSSTDPAFSLTLTSTASSAYALRVMTITAAVFFPLVLLYQGWSFHVFRERIRGPSAKTPVAAGVDNGHLPPPNESGAGPTAIG